MNFKISNISNIFICRLIFVFGDQQRSRVSEWLELGMDWIRLWFEEVNYIAHPSADKLLEFLNTGGNGISPFSGVLENKVTLKALLHSQCFSFCPKMSSISREN